MEAATLVLAPPPPRSRATNEWENLAANGPAVFYAFKIQGEQVLLVFVSGNVERLLGFIPAHSASYDCWLDNLHQEDREHVAASLGAALEQDRFSLEYRLRHRDGSYRWVEDHSRIVRAACGRPEEIVGIWLDITERKLADEALKMQGRILASMSEGVTVSDESGLILFSNDACHAMFGYEEEELIGQPWSVLKDAPGEQSRQFVTQLLSYLQNTGVWMGELNARKKDGSPFSTRARISYLELAGSKSFVSVFEDISETRDMERQLRRSQRMDSLSRLSSGIAQDLNNILAPILMSVCSLRTGLPPVEIEKALTVIETNTLRGADLIKTLLSFEHKTEGQRQIIQPNLLLEDLTRMIAGTFPKDIRVSLCAAPDCWPLMGTATEIYQVLLNLCLNARDAMPGGGTLTITSANLHFDESYVAMNPEVCQGHYVLIQVVDTGIGIPSDIIDKVFDPFFTTKQSGGNAGLGLSTSLSIVKRHDGLLNLKSEHGGGTTLEIYLPATPDAVEPSAAAAVDPQPQGQGELVLLVDDEEDLRTVMSKALCSSGYRVLTAADGIEAIALHFQHGADIKIVLTDLMMPSMDGVTMTRTLKRIDPSIKIIASSGMGNARGFQDKMSELRELGVNKLLAKPYRLGEVLSAMSAVLAAH